MSPARGSPAELELNRMDVTFLFLVHILQQTAVDPCWIYGLLDANVLVSVYIRLPSDPLGQGLEKLKIITILSFFLDLGGLRGRWTYIHPPIHLHGAYNLFLEGLRV